MASLDFPSSPTNGQTYSSAGITWTYDSTYTVWNVTSSGPVGYSGSQGYTGSKGDIGYSGSLGYTGSKGTDGVIGYNGSVGYTGSKGDIGYTGSLGYTGSGATGVNWTNKSATYTAVNTDGIIADTSGGSFTVTLPASPATGSYVVFIDGGNSFQTYPLTVAGNGSTIDGSYTSAVLNITNAKVEFIYSGSTWEMATSTGTRGYTGSLGYTGSVGYTGSLGYTGSGATGVNWTNKSTTYTAVNNDGIIANTSGGSFTVTLPASPSTGSYVVFLDGNSSFATYPLTVDGNGNNIADSYSTATLNITNSKVEFIYNGSTWEIATSTGTRGYSGSVGYTGSLGYTGSAGAGYTGSKGDIGYTGSQGYTGSKGDIGYTGSKGDIGYTGSQGYTGSKGDIGYTGSQGDIGYSGSLGYTGSKGDIGYTGSIPAALTATSLALGGATLGTNNLAVTGTSAFSSTVTHSGATTLSGALTYGGITLSNAVTGTGNMVLSASPTLTGTVTAAAANFSGAVGITSTGLTLTQPAATASNGLKITGTTTSRNYILIENTGSQLGLGVESSTGGSTFTGSSAYATVIGSFNATPVQFATNGAVRATLDTSGNLGIGITPSAWNTFNAAQVGLLSIASYTNGDTDISSNLYYNSGWKYIGTGRSAQIKLDSSTGGGDIKFLVDATGGTAAGATAGTEAARFDSSGNLLVGTTTSSDRLVVNGNNGIRISGISTGNRALYIPSGDILFDNPSARSEVRNDGNSSSELRLSGRGFVTVYTGGSGLGTGSERARFDGNGNLGIGITTPAKPLHVYKSGPAGASPSTPEIRIQHDDVNDIGTGGSAGGILSFYNIQRDNTGWAADATIGEIDWYLSQPTSGTAQNAARILCATNGAIGGTDTSTYMAFWTASGTTWYERMRIDSGGSLCIASTSSYGGYKLSATTNGGAVAIFVNTDTGGSSQTTLVFRRNTSDVGSISTTSSATAYNTSSDARLKTNVSDAAPASALIDAIQVRQFDWKADNSHQRYGMVAQELLEVAPEAVSVPADPEQMMGVDYSKLVPMMIKTIQELTTRLAALEAK